MATLGIKSRQVGKFYRIPQPDQMTSCCDQKYCRPAIFYCIQVEDVRNYFTIPISLSDEHKAWKLIVGMQVFMN